MSSFYFLLAAIPSIILHEVSHGWVAYHYGDPTAKNAKRLTLNPLRHIDPVGTILLPALLVLSGLPAFGWAKPVPVNVSRLRKPRQQSLYVSLAGPLTNVVLSAIGFVLCELALHQVDSQLLFDVGLYLGLVNIVLAAFNLLPIPPLDGSALIERFIPNRRLASYYRFRARALPVALVVFVVGNYFFHFFSNYLNDIEQWWINLLG